MRKNNSGYPFGIFFGAIQRIYQGLAKHFQHGLATTVIGAFIIVIFASYVLHVALDSVVTTKASEFVYEDLAAYQPSDTLIRGLKAGYIGRENL